MTKSQRAFIARIIANPRDVKVREFKTVGALLRRDWIEQDPQHSPYSAYRVTPEGMKAYQS